MKRLIVDRMEDMDEQMLGESRREVELLRRLMVCWDDSDQCLAELTREVDSWLEGRAESHVALRKARAALAEYQRLKSRKERDKLVIKALKERERITTFERDETHAIEQSLIGRLNELEAYLFEIETDRESLRNQIARYKLKNPLPHPPELPVPLNQLAAPYASTTNASSLSVYSMPSEDGPSSSSRRHSDVNGSTVNVDQSYITPFYASGSNSQVPQPQPQEAERDRKGKRKAKDSGRHSSAGVYTNGQTHRASASNNSRRAHPNGSMTEDERSVVFPGANAQQRRIVPPKDVGVSNTGFASENDDTPTDTSSTMNPYTLAALYLDEYVNGYGEGFNAGTVGLNQDLEAQESQMPGQYPQGAHDVGGLDNMVDLGGELEDETPRLTWGRQLFTEGAPESVRSSQIAHGSLTTHTEDGSTVRESLPTSTAGTPGTLPRAVDPEERLVYSGRRERSSTSMGINNVNSSGNGTNYADGHLTDSSLPSNPTNRNSDLTPSTSRSTRHGRRRMAPPGHETDVESVRRTRDEVGTSSHRSNALSVSSWGTISTTQGGGPNGTRHRTTQSGSSFSMSDLGLTSFGPTSMYAVPSTSSPLPLGSTPTSTLTLGLQSLPLREDDEILVERQPAAQGRAGGPDPGSRSRAAIGAGAGTGPSGQQRQQQQQQQQRTPRQRGERHVSFDWRPAVIGQANGGNSAGSGGAVGASAGDATVMSARTFAQPPVQTSAPSQATPIAATSSTDATNASRSAPRRSGRHGHSHSQPQGRSVSAWLPSMSASGGGNVSLTATEPNTSAAVEDASRLSAAEMPRPLPMTPPGIRNALGLQLDTAGRGSGDDTGGISAPTPIVSAERFLRSWSMGES
ncbi:hypothetical protein AX17_006011 [Amanita inopinata Kibby_2008]|nr:hypothetical protein AX17_006011 [Amanita inopinata Kibby_2008]